ncbi:hypothetical protein [Blastopirellula retiformator]|uniref:Amino acid permease n=1 Tax=Blastopirellula retiformator TaxID=2527970 RepID=A0A5C5V9P1_9BACT|nr:hypothetical protein [Blastopirellula retiformator]TWT34587.1 hypothetical protein Enr8_19990 [Blastopirellula retiformator]
MRKLLAATVTPLASIFGSGFLVIVPILSGAVGSYALPAMAIVCVVAYGVGAVIRYNIANAEPQLEKGTAPEITRRLEQASDLALVGAYIISVCLYINILASFLLGGIDERYDTPLNNHLISVAFIVAIGAIGYFKGLAALAKLEKLALGVTLLIIVALFVGFGLCDLRALSSGITWPDAPQHSWWEIVTIVGGTLIVVQGFETSRYLEDLYDAPTRIASCRLSQVISTVVYLIFIALATPLMHFLGDTVKDNDLILLAGKASMLLPLPVVIAAVLSQFSAAVADTFGGAGNAEEATHGHVDLKHATVLICGGAIILCFTPTLTILALASRAFAFYYCLQCLVATSVSKSLPQRAFFVAMAVVLALITLFAEPAG